MNHGGFVLFGDSIESFLDDMATESIHAQGKNIATNSTGNCNDLSRVSQNSWYTRCVINGTYLFRSTVLEAALNKKVAEAIDHKRICLSNDRLNDFEFLFHSANLELLLKKDRRLLIIVADNFVNDVLPVASDIAIKQTTVVQWLHRGDVGLPW